MQVAVGVSLAKVALNLTNKRKNQPTKTLKQHLNYLKVVKKKQGRLCFAVKVLLRTLTGGAVAHIKKIN